MSEELDLSAIPPSSLPRIPQSVVRPSHERQVDNPLLSSFQATPSRKYVSASSRRSNGLLDAGTADHGGYLPPSPLQQRRSSTQIFSVVPESAVKIPSNSTLDQGVQDTPVKRRPNIATTHGHPNMTNSGSNKENARVLTKENVQEEKLEKEDSIYKSLGWDDADDIDELG